MPPTSWFCLVCLYRMATNWPSFLLTRPITRIWCVPWVTNDEGMVKAIQIQLFIEDLIVLELDRTKTQSSFRQWYQPSRWSSIIAMKEKSKRYTSFPKEKNTGSAQTMIDDYIIKSRHSERIRTILYPLRETILAFSLDTTLPDCTRLTFPSRFHPIISGCWSKTPACHRSVTSPSFRTVV